MTESQRYIVERSIPVPEAGCWLWLLAVTDRGYGIASHEGERRAHRVAYRAFVGAIPDGMLVQHRCDERTCVAPHHLDLGKPATNMIDKQRKGRGATKLTPAIVAIIRERAAAGSPLRQLAREHGVSQRCVQFIVRREQWTHVP